MTDEQYNYEQGCEGQARAEYEAQMAYYEYLDGLIKDKKYQLHAIEIALEMLNSSDYASSGLPAKDYLYAERIRLSIKSLNGSDVPF